MSIISITKRLEAQTTQEKEIGSKREDKLKAAITYDAKKIALSIILKELNIFYIFNTETNEEKVIDNGGYTHHNLAAYLKLLGVSTLICGGIGLLRS